MSTTEQLTPKGQATRERIIEAAAALIYERGVQGTNNTDVRGAAGVSGSQLSHYFADKESLIRAVIGWRADAAVASMQVPELGGLDTLAALRRWADSYADSANAWRGGCTFGSLAAEVVKTDLDLHDELAAGFARWGDLFRDGLLAMRSRGDLRADADPQRLGYALVAAFQGGMLLAQVERDAAPLRAALDGALAYIASFAADDTPQAALGS